MYEIELKAHVYDHKAVQDRLDSFADYLGKVEKDDTYWHFTAPGIKHSSDRDYISARIRKETSGSKTDVLLTYKRKELRTKADGTSFEVNDEKECTLSAPEPLEALLTDTGFVPAVRKHKTVYDWQKDTAQGKALFELCTVPPLGDFLEIEILSPVNDSASVAAVHAELVRLLAACGIAESAIEPRFYTDMLNEASLTKCK